MVLNLTFVQLARAYCTPCSSHTPPPFRYSFCTPPRLDLNVRPTLGEREVTFTHVTEWIEKKLQCEFQVSPSELPLQEVSRIESVMVPRVYWFSLFPESVCHAQYGRPIPPFDDICPGKSGRTSAILRPRHNKTVVRGVPGLLVRVVASNGGQMTVKSNQNNAAWRVPVAMSAFCVTAGI